MAVYGIDFYGEGRFGQDPALILPGFAVDPFTSTPLDYSTLFISWTQPVSPDCINLRLVRNNHNLPQSGGQPPGGTDDASANADGAVVFTDIVARTPSWTDTGLGQGFAYYTMWGWSNSEQLWIRCSDLIGLVPLNWGYGNRLYDLLPMAYRDADIILVDPYNPWPEGNPSPPLQRYLSLLGFQMDFIRTELESLMSVNDAQNCSGALLPLLAQQFGLPHEPEIGMQQERQLVSNAIHLYKLKGSPRGLTEFTSIMTNYPSTVLVHHGYNELLCMDDGVMTDAIGTWQAWPPAGTNFPALPGNTRATTTLAQNPNMLTGPTAVAGMTNPLEPPMYAGFNPGPPTYNYSGMKISGSGAGDLVLTTGPIPITDFMSSEYGPGTITFRVQLWSAVARSVSLSVWGDNGSGLPIEILPSQAPTRPPAGGAPSAPAVSMSATTSLIVTQFAETAGHWTVFTVTGSINPYPNGLGNPAAFYWIYPRVRIIGAAANEAHYMTLCGLWPCSPSDIGANTPVNTPYDYPRDVKVTLQPEYANVLSNTCTTFANGFDGLSNTADPTQVPTAANQTCGISILYTDVEDPAGLFSVNGAGSLTVQAGGPGATVWWGLVNTWSPAPPNPNGWFAIARTSGPIYTDGKREDWFAGAQQGSANPRNWFDPAESWNFINQQYFGIGSGWVNGVWFAAPPQPNYPGVAGSFEPFTASGPFNFSVYARYTSVLDPNNAAMVMGLRWYYPDGTWTEVAYAVTLTGTFARYSIAPADRTQDVLSQPPPEAVTGDMPVTFYPFVRFPRAQQATFLLNSAMLSPGLGLQPYTDASMGSSSGDYVQDSHGASYYYNNRVSRVARLNAELYRWLPMGATYTLIYGAGAVVPPLDPTLW